jgi:hypothetical protein
MFQFPPFAPRWLVSHQRVTTLSRSWVAPFGNLRVKVCLTTLRSLSQFNHVLHRLLLPRYPPYALSSFTFSFLKLDYIFL